MEYISEIFKTEYSIFAWMITSVITIISIFTIFKNGHELAEWFKKLNTEKPEQIDFSRRAAIKIIGGVTLLTLVWVNGRKVYTDYKNGRKVIDVSEKSRIVAHKKSGIIHLAGRSKGALPSKKWATTKIDLVRYNPYRGAESSIYEAIASESIHQRNDEITVYSYLLAIKSNPLSYHLYDKLTRIYGRRKEYEQILELHTFALKNLSSMGLSRKRLKRAKKEFTKRVDSTKKRALLS
jgi:hypothetical protein